MAVQFLSPHKDRMPTPWVLIQLGNRFYQTHPQWIQMNITDQFKQVGVFLADDRFVAILKEMPRSFVLEVEDNRVTGQKTPHEYGKLCRPWAEQQMEMIGHERPGKAFGAGFGEEF
jgi:hypothetical protein